MGRYPAETLDMKFEWMRAKQRKKAEKAARKLAVVPAAAPPPEPLPRMLRVNQVAEVLGVSRQTVERWFEGRAVIVQGRNNRVMLIPQRLLDEWIREHTAH